ncbi:MAG: hypothetical protein ACRENY_06970 [Candidatus Dormibacteria bacterium]
MAGSASPDRSQPAAAFEGNGEPGGGVIGAVVSAVGLGEAMKNLGRRRLAAIGGGLAALALLTAAGGQGFSSARATQQVISFFQTNQTANQSLNGTLLGTVESGISAAMDVRNYQLLAGLGEHSEAYAAIPGKAQIAVSLASGGTPSTFLALVKWPATSTAPAWRNYLLFHRTSKSGPWRVLYEPAISAGVVTPHLLRGAAKIRFGTGKSEFARYAKYLSGTSGEPFAKGPLTSQLVAQNNAAEAQSQQAGINSSESAKAGSSPVVTVAVKGGTLEFGSILTTYTLTSVNGCVSTAAAADASVQQQEVIELAPAGVNYQFLHDNDAWQVAIFVPSRRHKQAQVVANDGQLMTVSDPSC